MRELIQLYVHIYLCVCKNEIHDGGSREDGTGLSSVVQCMTGQEAVAQIETHETWSEYKAVFVLNRLSIETVKAVKTWMLVALSNLLSLIMLWAGSWVRQSPKVSSNICCCVVATWPSCARRICTELTLSRKIRPQMNYGLTQWVWSYNWLKHSLTLPSHSFLCQPRS